MNREEQENPFDPAFDPDYRPPVASHSAAAKAAECGCGLTRRSLLVAAGGLAAAPLLASADAMVPCVQTQQKVQPCQHKFCRHYGGGKDYYGR